MPCSNPRNNCHFIRSMLEFSDSFSLLHQHRSIALMLEFIWISCMNRNDRSIDVKLSYQRTFWAKLWSEGIWSTLSQTKKANQNILLWILIRNKGLPSFISYIVSSNQLNILWLYLEMNLFYSHFSSSNVSTRHIHLTHFSEG